MKVRMLLVFVVLAAVSLMAQTFRGGIVGTVVDSTGASVAGAKVRATNVGTGLVRESVTGAEGDFNFPELPLGDYSVTITKEGFRTQTATGIHVGVGTPERVNVTLTPGKVEQTIEVNADVPLVETTSNTMGGTLEATQVTELPVNGRDYTKMLTAVPGSNADPAAVADSPGSFGVFAVNGNRGRSNNFTIDGTDMNDGFRNDPAINEGGVYGIPATLLPVDAIQELAILNNTEAEYGRNSGSIVNIVTKSGTNALHGTALEYFRNNHLDARNYFNQKPDPANIFINNQFGGSLGGPIVKDKTFWYLAYEGQREKVGIPAPATIPSQAMITAATPVAGINPIIQNILNTNPWGILPATGSNSDGSQNIEVTTNATNRLDNLITKIDHHLGKSDLLTGRYFFGDSSQSAPLAIVGGNLLPGFNTVVPTRVQVVSLSLTHVVSSKLLLEVRGGWNRFAETFSAQDVSLNPASLGLNTTTDPLNYGLPVISVSGLAGLGANKSNPRGRVDTNFQYFTNFSYNSGRHNWKYGYEFRRTSVAQYFNLNHRGKLSFASLDNFLAGIVDGGSQTFGDSHRHTYQNSHGFYLQDNFRFTHKLTINYGVRWDYFGVIGEKNNLFSIFDPNVGLEQVGVGNGPASVYPKDFNNFSPRVGVAYDLDGSGRTVLRAGWGVAYDAFSQDFFAGQIPYNSSNAGMVFNGIGSRPILYGGVDTNALVVTSGPCATGQIPVPGTSQGCTGPVFSGFAATDVFSVAQNTRTPYVQNYNLNLERQLGSKTAVMVSYVGSQGRKLFHFRDINQTNPATGVRPFDNGPFTPPAGMSPGGGPFGYVNQFESSASSGYNSLQAKLTVHNLHGLYSTVNYTWSHSIDTASDGQDYSPNQSMPDNSFNPAAERGNSGFDVRHHFSWLFNYKFPEGQTMHWLSSGWGLDGVLSLSTGMPFTVNDYNIFNGSGEYIERPDVVGDPLAGRSIPNAFLNLSAFAAPCPVASLDIPDGVCNGTPHFGSERRNQYYGPHYRNFDLAFTKDNKLTERVGMQLRVDFFNIFNHPNFANPVLPNFIVDWTTNGIDPTTGRGQGFLPLTVTPDVGAQNPYLGGGGPRNIEIALRFSF